MDRVPRRDEVLGMQTASAGCAPSLMPGFLFRVGRQKKCTR